MTPAVEIAKKSGVDFDLHSYPHDEGAGAYGLEAAEKMDVPAAQIFKTLVIEGDGGGLAVAIVPVTCQLSLKRAAKALGFKKAKMAAAADVERATGYVLGGVSPLGQKKRLPTVLDASADAFGKIYVSAGKRGLEISMAPADLGRLTGACMHDIAEGETE